MVVAVGVFAKSMVVRVVVLVAVTISRTQAAKAQQGVGKRGVDILLKLAGVAISLDLG